ncbi:unnamed protein product [Tilletia caries]|nr:unnamed protein product [Tilletia caries]
MATTESANLCLPVFFVFTGVYNNWSDAKAATNGYSNNCHQSFRSPQEASQFVQQGGAYSKQDWAQSQGGQSSNGYKPK